MCLRIATSACPSNSGQVKTGRLNSASDGTLPFGMLLGQDIPPYPIEYICLQRDPVPLLPQCRLLLRKGRLPRLQKKLPERGVWILTIRSQLQ